MKKLLILLVVLLMGSFADVCPAVVTNDSTTWEGKYEADTLPSAAGFTATGENYASVSSGILTVNTMGSSAGCFWNRTPGFNLTTGGSIEWRVRLRNANTFSMVSSYLEMSSTSCGVATSAVSPVQTYTGVGTVSNTGVPSLAGQFNTIRLTAVNGVVKLYVNGQLDTIDNIGAPNNSTTYNRLVFGDVTGADDVLFDVDYIRWTTAGAFEPPPPPLPWIDARSCGAGNYTDATINAALTAIGTVGKKTLLVSTGTWQISNSIVIPPNVTLKFEPGAVLDIAQNKTIDVNGFIEAGKYQIFSGSGTVHVRGYVDALYPQWWGAKGDGVTDDTAAVQACINSSVSSNGVFSVYGGDMFFKHTIKFPSGVYRVTSELSPNKSMANQSWVGDGGMVEIRYDGTADATKAVFGSHGVGVLYCSFKNIFFNANYRVGFAVNFEAGEIQQLVKMNQFEKCVFGFATVANFNLGASSNWDTWAQGGTCPDIDGDQNVFYECDFISAPEGFVNCADNVYRTAFYSCCFGFWWSADRDIAEHYIRAVRGNGITVVNTFFAPMDNRGATVANIYMQNGALSVMGGSSEEPRFLRAVGMAQPARGIYVEGFSINSQWANSDYTIYATHGNITLVSCDFAYPTASQSRKIYIGQYLSATDVQLGPSGTYEFASADVSRVSSISGGQGTVTGSYSLCLIDGIRKSTAAPTAGTWARGDVVWNSNAASATSPGWVCVTAGTPGTWKGMANLK